MLATRYMEIFYGEEPIENLTEILSENLSFKGPLYEFSSSEEYIESLKSEPPVGLKYEMIEAYEKENSACLVYQFSKPGISTIMSQLFEITNGKISKIILVFDTGAFS